MPSISCSFSKSNSSCVNLVLNAASANRENTSSWYFVKQYPNPPLGLTLTDAPKKSTFSANSSFVLFSVSFPNKAPVND